MPTTVLALAFTVVVGEERGAKADAEGAAKSMNATDRENFMMMLLQIMTSYYQIMVLYLIGALK